MDQIKDKSVLLKKPKKVVKMINYPTILGGEDVEMRQHLLAAHRVNKRVEEAEGVRRLG
jgi:hypothetical protein